MVALVLPLLLLHSHAFFPVALGQKTNSCIDLAARVLRRNRPEFILVPDAGDHNNFVTSRVEVALDWTHIRAILDPACLKFFLVEYGPRKQLVAEERYIRDRTEYTI